MEFKEDLQPRILLCPPLLLCNKCSLTLHQPGSYSIAAASHRALKINRTAHNGRSPWQI